MPDRAGPGPDAGTATAGFIRTCGIFSLESVAFALYKDS
jgi:hypothetical protein